MAREILMCPPKFFDIEYEINPWMHQDDQPSELTATQQWQKLHDIYKNHLSWDVRLIKPIKGLPDMVFATDCGTIIDGKILLSNFRYPERQPETKLYEQWFTDNGYGAIKHARNFFEGGGDTMLYGDKIIAGYGFRSTPEAHQELQDYFNREVISLRIIDPNFYHLDTSLSVLDEQTVAYYPGALDEPSRQKLQRSVPRLIEATLAEARGFGLNAVSDAHTIITSDASDTLLQKYRDVGFKVIGTPILEFRKSGGGVKCLTLEL